jgi:DNA-binding transcriptional regulator YdaS (Cro superfamily)
MTIDIQEAFDTSRGMRLRVAKALKITHGAVSQWKRVPAERVLTVEKVTGIPRHILRPDLYPDPMEAAE